MDSNKNEQIRKHAYKLWEDEGRPEGLHDDHWSRAEQHAGMMGDGTEEQGLGQPGNPEARIIENEVLKAFSKSSVDPAQK